MNTSTKAFFTDNTITPLLSSFVYFPFNFAAQYLQIMNDDLAGTNQVIYSFDGSTTHGKLKPQEKASIDEIDAAGIYLKFATGAPAYRAMARPEKRYE